MSHRITLNAQLKDRKAAAQALKKKKWDFREEDDRFQITTGPMARAFINFSTGAVEGDSDLHSKSQLGGLNQAYSEEMMLGRISDEGGLIEERLVLGDGTIRLVVQA